MHNSYACWKQKSIIQNLVPVQRIQKLQVSQVQAIKDKIRMMQNKEEPHRSQTFIVKIQEWYIRDNIAQNLCKKLLLFFCTFQDTSEGLQSTRTILKIYQKGCLAAILKVWIYYPRNMKFTSSTFIFRGGLLGNKWFYWYLTDSSKSTRLCRLCIILPIVQGPFYQQYITLPIVVSLLSAECHSAVSVSFAVY